MSYSSYLTQQDTVTRVIRLEVMLGLLIKYTIAGNTVSPGTRDLLLNFAGVLEAERNQQVLNKEPTPDAS